MGLVPFVSTDDLEAMLGTTLADPSALIVQIALDAGCTAVRTYLGQDINLVEDDVEVHSGSGRRKMRLRQRPVRSVSEVLVDETVADPTTYNLRSDTLTLTDTSWWEPGDDNIAVTYTHGWDIEEAPDPDDTVRVPADIRFVALSVARRVYLSVGETAAAGGGIISETMGDYSYTLATEAVVASASSLTEYEVFALDKYRVELVGSTPTQ